MIGHRCKNCIWWDNQHSFVATIEPALSKKAPGICRKHKPGSIKIGVVFYGVQPVMDADDFCGEFRPEKDE